MINLSREDAIKNHRKMWNWIADETLKRGRPVSKIEYFDEIGMPEEIRPYFNCYCCEYDLNNNDEPGWWCKNCPVDWRTLPDKLKRKNRICTKSFYNKWEIEKNRAYPDYKKCAKLARKIANLPTRKIANLPIRKIHKRRWYNE